MTKATAKAAMTVDPPAIPMINPREDARSGIILYSTVNFDLKLILPVPFSSSSLVLISVFVFVD